MRFLFLFLEDASAYALLLNSSSHGFRQRWPRLLDIVLPGIHSFSCGKAAVLFSVWRKGTAFPHRLRQSRCDELPNTKHRHL